MSKNSTTLLNEFICRLSDSSLSKLLLMIFKSPVLNFKNGFLEILSLESVLSTPSKPNSSVFNLLFIVIKFNSELTL